MRPVWRRVAGGARRWWRYALGRTRPRPSLWRSFAVGMAATTAVTLLTYRVVAAGPGVEANPLLRWVIGTHGWAAFLVVRYAAVLGVFVLLWSVASLNDDWASWSEGNGRMAAAILSANAVRDGVVAATGVTPTLELLRLAGLS